MVKNKQFISSLFSLLLSLCVAAIEVNAADVSIHKNEVSGLYTWKSEDNGFSIELIQLLPDFIRAIYAKHNFPEATVEDAASYCMFGTIIKNTSDQPLSYRVADWRYRTHDEKYHMVKTKTQWLDEWRKVGIIFSWTLLPDAGEFEKGDWQQGFTSIKLPRNERFDLIYKWAIDGVQHQGELKDLICPPESISK